MKLARTLGLVPWTLEIENMEDEPYRDTRGPGRDGVLSLLKELDRRADAKAARDRAMVRLLFDLALRRAEVVRLDLEDLDLERGTLAVLGKGRTGKVLLTLPGPTKATLAAWVRRRGDRPGALFTAFP